MPIPIFLCSTCFAEHTRLWPSAYGVFFHRCHCRTLLPTLDILGRKKLQRLCANPSCRIPLHESIGRATNIHIPIVGGAAAGKSTFIVQSTHQLLAYAARKGYDASFPDPRDERDFQDAFQSMNQGVLLQKTIVQLPKAYTLLLQPPKGHVGKLLYLYDAAGEFFESAQALRSHTFHRYTHGILFLLDPFSIPSVVQDFSASVEAHRQEINPCQLEPEAVYTRLFHLTEAKFGIRRSPFPLSLAVVLPKIDACGLERILGKEAAQSRLASDTSLETIENASHALARDFLLKYRQQNLVRLMEAHFANVRYFPCSALGRLPQLTQKGAPFVPQASFEPLLWLLQQQKVFQGDN